MIFLCTLFLASVESAQAQSFTDYYSFQDSRGVIHFSDHPPEVPRFTIHRFYSVRESVRDALNRLSKNEIRRLIGSYSQEFGVEPALIEAIVKAESSYDPSAVSRKGARGLMQLMPATAQSFGVADLHDPQQNLRGGIQHLRRLLDRYHGDMALTAAAYNAGENAVTKHGGIPPYPETVDYVQKVRKYYTVFRENSAPPTAQDGMLSPEQLAP